MHISELCSFFQSQVHPGVRRHCERATGSRTTTHIISGQHRGAHPPTPASPRGSPQLLWCKISREPRPCLGCASEERVCSQTTRITVWDVFSMRRPDSAETTLPVGCHLALTFWSVLARHSHSEFSSLPALLTSCFLHSSAPLWIFLGAGF